MANILDPMDLKQILTIHVGEYPNFRIDHSKLEISKGPLLRLHDLK